MAAALNPDCRDGKHRACSGTAWDFDADETVACACHCHAAAVRLSEERHRRLVDALWDERYQVRSA